MSYQVVLTPKARDELYGDALWWSEHRDPEQAARWLEGFEAAILSLSDAPERHPLAPESATFEIELRQMTYGLSSKPTHRAVFEVQGPTVIVHAVRHLARRDLNLDD